ncbi:cyclodeaminase/cyclohydrolase family protein [Pseudonocardia acaciae]|uniref:cyclodeaminase/cyclohydrolase family protein n=1 Tax=Pseudonocardia acaciae TaxID=551276 RepID=UPI0006853293|nr:cyclodeaminase/cyclohydrolase family protein [Pseudonocardia acaciae]
MSERYGDVTVGEFLGELAARRPAPSGGAAAALTLAMAAGLTAMAARFSRSDELAALAGRADELRARALALADADAAAYAEVLAAGRDRTARGEAMRAATEVPLEMARHGAEVAKLAARLAAEGNQNLAGDARTAVLLAEAGVRAAAELVGINVRHGELDGAAIADARAYVRAAQSAANTP